MPLPLVSICIPCHNQGGTIGASIESALSQTHPNTEIVVVDDGSTDDSLSVVRGFGDRIRFETGPQRGAPAARNRALALARGDFINFLDGDDLFEPDKIARQLPPLLADEADIVLCKGNIFGDGKPLRPKKAPLPPPGDTDPFVYALNYGFSTCGPLHRRGMLEKVGGFREDLRRGQESELHLRMTAAGARLGYVGDLLYSVRHHDGPRITRTPLPPDHWLLTLRELADWLERSPVVDFSPLRRGALAGMIFQHSMYAWRNGLRDSARAGFAHAGRLSKEFPYHERRWYRALQPLIGVVAMERILDVARAIRRRA